jgi:hypothetical protein
MNLYLVRMRENGLKNIEKDARTLKLTDSGWPPTARNPETKLCQLVAKGCQGWLF